MKDNRDMFYNSYGFAGGIPNMMMNIPNNMMMQPPLDNTNNQSYPNNGMNNVSNINIYSDIDNRLNKIERQIKRLEQRISRIESPYSNNTTNIYNEPDNNMYMI